MANIFFVKKDVEDNMFMNDSHKKILVVVFYCVIYASLLACIWFYSSCVENTESKYIDGNWLYSGHTCSSQRDTWISNDSVLVVDSYISRYVRSLHFIAQTMFTVGFGDIFPTNDAEFSYGLFLLGNGALFFAFLISSVTSMISHRDVATTKFREEVDRVKKYLRARRVPAVLTDSVGNYFDFLFTKQCGMKESRFLSNALAPRLCAAINAHCGEQLRNVPFFVSQKAAFVDLCMQRLEYRSYAPGSTVMERSELFRELVLVRSGRVDIRLNKDKNCCLSLVAGDYIGDYQLIFRVRSDYHGRAAAFTEVMVLTYEAFADAVRVYSRACLPHRRARGRGLAPEDNDEYMWLLAQADSIRSTREQYQSQLTKFAKSQESALALRQSNRKIFAMMEDLQVRRADFVVLPNDVRVLAWNVAYCLLLLYYLLATPLRILVCFGRLRDFSPSLIVDYIFDAAALLELLLRTKYFAYTKIEGERELIVTDSAEIWAHFTGSWRCCGAVALVLPVDLLAALCGHAVLFRLTRVVAALLLPSVIGDILRFLEREYLWSVCEDGLSMLVIGLYTALFIVWTAALWSMVHFGGEQWASSVYWVLTTITTVGFGDVTPASTWETVFVISVTVVGPSLFAVNVGGIISYVKRTDVSADSVEHRRAVTRQLVDHMRSHCHVAPAGEVGVGGVDASSRRSEGGEAARPASLPLESLDRYFDFLDRERCGAHESFLVQYLPGYFREEVRCALLLPLLAGTYAFKSLDAAALRGVVRGLEERVFFQREVVVECNQSTNGVYFILKGAVTLCGSGDVYLERKEAGELFGEASLLEGAAGAYRPRARASRDCELWFISRQALEAALRAFPEENSARLREAVSAHCRHKSCNVGGKKNRMNGIIGGNLHHILQLGERFDSKRPLSVRPDGSFMLAWSALLVFFTLYSAAALPFRAAFLVRQPVGLGFLADYLGDAVFLADMMLRACALAYHDQGDLVVGRARIFKRYLSSACFVRHALSLAPTDLLVLAPGLVSPAQSAAQTLSLLRLNRLLRLADLPQHMCLLDGALSGARFPGLARLGGGAGRNVYRLCKLIAAVLLVAHVGGCFFFCVGNRAHLHGDADNWLDRQGLAEHCSLGLAGSCAEPSPALLADQYVHSLYWAVTLLTTTGYGDIVPVSASEEALTIALLLLGSLIFALIQVHLQEIISHLDVTSDIHSKRAQRVSAFLLRERAPDGLRARSAEYLERLWAVTRGASASEVAQLLPPCLYARLGGAAMAAHNGPWGSFYLRACDEHFRSALLSRMRFELYLPGDCMFKGGELSRRLFFLLNEERDVRLMDEASGVVYCCVTERCLGEGEFFSRTTYSCSAKVLAETTVLALDFTDFWTCLQEFGLVDHYLGKLRGSEGALDGLLTAAVVRRVARNMSQRKIAKLCVSDGAGAERTPLWLPAHPLRRAWAAGAMLIAVYMAVTAPYFASFGAGQPAEAYALLAGDVVATVFMVVDIYFNLYVFAAVVGDKLVMLPDDTYRLYLAGEFVWDLLGALPLPLLALAATGDLRTYCLLRLLHMSWLRRVRRGVRSCVCWLEAASRLSVPEALLSVSKALLTVCYACHVAACLFAAIGLAEQAADRPSWVALLESDGARGVYLRALYWATYTVTTVGYGGISLASNGERVLAMLVMITGIVLCNAGVAAVLGSIISGAIALRSGSRRCREAALRFCRSNGVGGDVQAQVQDYFSYNDKQMHSSCERDDFEQLSPALRMDFVSVYAEEALGALCFLGGGAGEAARTGFVRSVCRLLRPYLATPGELLVEDGACVAMDCGALVWRGGDLLVLRRGRVFVTEGESGRSRRMQLVYPGSVVAPTGSFGCSRALAATFTLTADAAAGSEDRALLCLSLGLCSVECDGEALRAASSLFATVTCGELTRRSTLCEARSSGHALSGAWIDGETLLLAVPAGAATYEVSLFAVVRGQEVLLGSVCEGVDHGACALSDNPLGALSDAETESTSTGGVSEPGWLQRRLACREGAGAAAASLSIGVSVYAGEGGDGPPRDELCEGPAPLTGAAAHRAIAYKAYAETYCHLLKLSAHDLRRLIAEYGGADSSSILDRYGGGGGQALVRGRGPATDTST